MQIKITQLLLVIASYLSTAALGWAGPLPTDPNAIPGWTGTTSFFDVNTGFTLDVDVEYAVYAPGMFGTSAALGNPAASDPSGGMQFVYAYEAFSDAAATAGLTTLSISLVPGAIPTGSTNVGHALAIGQAPDLSRFIPVVGDPKGSVQWTFATQLLPGANSNILLFTSPFGPQTLTASVNGGNATHATESLPSPTPEPGTMVLLGLGCATFLLTKSSRERLRRASRWISRR